MIRALRNLPIDVIVDGGDHMVDLTLEQDRGSIDAPCTFWHLTINIISSSTKPPRFEHHDALEGWTLSVNPPIVHTPDSGMDYNGFSVIGEEHTSKPMRLTEVNIVNVASAV